VVVTLAIVAYLATTIGFPLPAAVSKRGGAFPCQHHACGCATAAQCWDHCCCFTPSEKLAWAHEHHVEPPAKLIAEVAALEAESHTAAEVSATHPAPRKSCCAHHDYTACETESHSCATAGLPSSACPPHESSTAQRVNRDTHSAAHHDHDHHHANGCCEDHDEDDDSLGITLVIGVKARQCRGLADSWCQSGAVVPAPPSVTWQFQWNVVEWLALDSTQTAAAHLAPPIRPPRV
jgi:hypothetical protein